MRTPIEFPVLVWLPAIQMIIKWVDGFDWSRVKPMYMVPMLPPTMTSNVYERHPRINNVDIDGIPQVVDLETELMEADMLPGGIMAMNRIFGGSIAEKRSFPYQVGLLLQRPKGLYWCGGSLISDEYVLTAAHCVDMAKKALVFLGAFEIKNSREVGQMRMKVTQKNFIIYPSWNPKRLKDDIAIVRLPMTIVFTEKIQPISLPRSTYVYRTFPNKLAIASGWGRYATGVHAISNVLRYVHLQIIEDWVCKRNFPMVYRTTNICTSGKRAKSTCNGDSGGPLVLQCKSSKRRVLVGITSFGSIYGCNRGYPAAYTKVASYLDWISDQTGIDPSYAETSNAALVGDYLRNYKNIVIKRERERYVDQYDDDALEKRREKPPYSHNLRGYTEMAVQTEHTRKKTRKI